MAYYEEEPIPITIEGEKIGTYAGLFDVAVHDLSDYSLSRTDGRYEQADIDDQEQLNVESLKGVYW